MPVVFHRLAAPEFVTARRWYARRSRAAEGRFVAAFDLAVRRIDADPGTGTAYRDRFRWVKVRRFPYLLYYDDASDPARVFVYAVAHANRRPGYWLRRASRS